MSLTKGQVFAGYTVVRPLGTGGMGEVYLVRHPRLPRLDALKVLPESVSADEEFRARFNREADLAATLWHPHIVGVHDRGEFEGRLWISMDYVEGNDAARLSRTTYPLGMPTDDVVEIVSAVAEALDYAHESGLLHRDVKPSNILLTAGSGISRRILLADFGIARYADDDGSVTRTNMTVGSVSYTAPEQLMGEAIDGRADQYSLAATAFHLLTGAPPFVHSNPAVVISRHLGTPPPALSDFRPELRAYDAVITRALAKNPTERYASCREFAQTVAVAATGIAALPAAAADPAPTTETPAEPTTQLSTPPTIDAPPDPGDDPTLVSPAEPTIQHGAAPIVVSAWGTDGSAENSEPPPAREPVAAVPRRRLPPALVAAAVVAAIALIAVSTFAIMDSSQPTPTAAPTTTPSAIEPSVSATAAPPATHTSTRTVTETAPAPPPTPTPPPYPSSQPSGRAYTVPDYIRDNGILETPVHRGDPGAPALALPFPPGWSDAGARTPEWAYGAIVHNYASPSDPPTFIALMSKLTGNVDPDRILEYAPNELENLSGYQSPKPPLTGTLDGYNQVVAAGTYYRDGQRRGVVQLTVVIPGSSGLYVLQLNGDALVQDIQFVLDAALVINQQTVISR
jgi:serine/threonine-protein kinase